MIRASGGMAKASISRSARLKGGRGDAHQGDEQDGKQDRPEHGELRADEFERAQRIEPEPGALDVAAGVAERGKAVGRGSNGCWARRQRGDRKREPDVRRAQQRARIAVEPGGKRRAEQEIHHRVLGEQAEAERDAEDDGPARARAGQELHVGEERQRPEEQERHVGRNDARRERRPGASGDRQRRKERDAFRRRAAARARRRRGWCRNRGWARARGCRPRNCRRRSRPAAMIQASRGGLEK